MGIFGVLLLAYLAIGMYISGLLLSRATEEDGFDELAFSEIVVGFFLHVLIWPVTIYMIISE